MKNVLITGVTGQDGSYLAEILLEKGYKVVGLKRRTSTINTSRIDHLYNKFMFSLKYWDADDALSIVRIIDEVAPDEIYNLSAQSHVKVSFELPEHTFNSVAISTLRLLEAITYCRYPIKLYQASSSEAFGSTPPPQNEQSPFDPQSPYAIAKTAAYHLIRNYRNAYNIFASNGILFNHESPRRGETFVSKKITQAIAKIKTGQQECLTLGNLYSKRDWGHAQDYMNAVHLMLQYDKPDDFVIATGESHTIKEFCDLAFKFADIDLEWIGKGFEESAIDRKTGKTVIKVSEKYFRPTEVDSLCGDASKARRELNWKPSYTFETLVQEMVEYDLNNVFHECPF
jgi:GDPmannose 4,6-dehydratase